MIMTRTETENLTYDKLSDGATDIRTIGNIVNVIQNGGYDLSGKFVPSVLLNIEDNGANLTAKPTVESFSLAIHGTVADEKSEFNNEHSIIFRWKELVASPIKFNPQF